MKKLTTNLLKMATLFTLTMFLFASCKEANKEDKAKEIVEELKTLDKESLEKVKSHLISNKEVFKLYKNYNDVDSIVNKYLPQVRNLGEVEFNDTRSVLIDFEVLENYLTHVRNVSNGLKVKPEGIKIVLGSYDSKAAKYANQTNVILVPTTKISGRQAAYTTVNNKLVYFKDLKKKVQAMNIQTGSFLMSMQDEDPGLGLNRGRPIPPPNNDDPDFQ